MGAVSLHAAGDNNRFAMENGASGLDLELAMQLIVEGRSNDEVISALVMRGHDAGNSRELVEGFRQIVDRAVGRTRGALPASRDGIANVSKKRDKELQRLLLLSVRDGVEAPELAAYPAEQRTHNKALLIKDGLVEGEIVPDVTGSVAHAVARELTSKGHDFLDERESQEQPNLSLRDLAKMGREVLLSSGPHPEECWRQYLTWLDSVADWLEAAAPESGLSVEWSALPIWSGVLNEFTLASM